MSATDPQSGCRLPALKREDLDEIGKEAYDEALTPRSIAGLQGPAGIQLYSTRSLPHLRGLTRYLRNEAGFSARTREIAILTIAREMDCQVQWVMHEEVAIKGGVEQSIIDVIKHRRPIDGLAESDAVVIALGRETFGHHKVSTETFARAQSVFGPHQLVDLLLLMGTTACSAGLLIAVDMQLQGGRQPSLPVG